MVKVYLSQLWQEKEHTPSLSIPRHRWQSLGNSISKTDCVRVPENGVWCFQKCWGLSRLLNRNELVSVHGLLRKLMQPKLCLWEGFATAGVCGEEDEIAGSCLASGVKVSCVGLPPIPAAAHIRPCSWYPSSPAFCLRLMEAITDL